MRIEGKIWRILTVYRGKMKDKRKELEGWIREREKFYAYRGF